MKHNPYRYFNSDDEFSKPPLEILGRSIYISGPITGVKDYEKYFNLTESELSVMGARQVINPARLPHGWDYKQYMLACMALVPTCDTILLLNGWTKSKGCRAEKSFAESLGLDIIF